MTAPFSHLDVLEAEAIHIFREAAAQFRKPVLLYSIGKDSAVLTRLAQKAFAPGRVPFPLLHIDTTWKFKDMIAFRDKTVRELGLDLIVHTNHEGLERSQVSSVCAELSRRTGLPVIANGDIRTRAAGLQVLRETNAAGLMLGRGAIADPLLFERLRGRAVADPDREERAALTLRYLRDLLGRYRELSFADTRVLGKLKGVLATMDDPCFGRHFKELLKSEELRAFSALLNGLE